MKNFLIKSICLILVTIITFSLCGCFETVREYDVGDFRVVLALGQKDRKDPNNYLNLIGLSEAGKQKKIIVLPKKIEVTPDTPEREGYTFGGWYTEEECENKFDFNTVFNTPVLEEGDIYPDDYVTYLYAKWTKNEG